MSSKDIHDMQDPRHQFYDGKYEKQQQEALQKEREAKRRTEG